MTRLLTLTAAALVLAWPRPADATPLDAADVPADARWVFHLDADALRDSELGRDLIDALTDGAFDLEVEAFSDVIGINLVDALSSVTAYGQGFSEDATVILITAQGGSGNLEGLMLGAPGYNSTTQGDRVVHSFINEDNDNRMFVVIDRINGGRDTRLTAAYNSDLLSNALDRLDNDSRRGGVAVSPKADAFLFAYVTDLDAQAFDEDGKHSAILEMVQQLTFNMTASDRKLIAEAAVEVINEQRAEQMRQLAQGMIAFTQFRDPDDFDDDHHGEQMLAELARQIVVTRDGRSVSATLETEAELGVDMIEIISLHAHEEDDEEFELELEFDEEEDEDDEHGHRHENRRR